MGFLFVLTGSYAVQVAVPQRTWQFSFPSLGRAVGCGIVFHMSHLGEEKFCLKLFLLSHQRKIV